MTADKRDLMMDNHEQADGDNIVLIVEDQALMRYTLRSYLEQAFPDLSIIEAADGAGALEACAVHRPGLVLMDISLPDANGIELTAQIRKMRPETRVIVVSAHDTQAYISRAHAAGAVAYVVKDYLYRDLIPAVSKALDRA